MNLKSLRIAMNMWILSLIICLDPKNQYDLKLKTYIDKYFEFWAGKNLCDI